MDLEQQFIKSFTHIPQGQHIYIYGAGGRGTLAYNLMQQVRPDITIVGFISTHGNGECCGLKVIAIDELKIKPHEVIVVASYAGHEIYAEIFKRKINGYLLMSLGRVPIYSECILAITSQCNSKCLFCTFPINIEHKIDNSIQKGWTPKYINSSFNIAALAQRIQLTGGEPLLHTNIQQIVQWACNNDKFIEVITNGIALSSKKIMGTVVPNLGQLSVSFASPDKRLQTYLMPNTDPDVLLQRLQQAKRVNEHLRIHMNLIIHKKTLETIDLLADYLCRAKVDSITFNTLSTKANSHPDVFKHLIFTSQQEKDEAQIKVNTITETLKRRSIVVDNAFARNQVYAEAPATQAELSTRYTKRCLYPWTRTFVGLDGTIWSCCNREKPLLTVLEHYEELPAKKAELQRNFLEGTLPQVCKQCNAMPTCTTDELRMELFKMIPC